MTRASELGRRYQAQLRTVGVRLRAARSARLASGLASWALGQPLSGHRLDAATLRDPRVELGRQEADRAISAAEPHARNATRLGRRVKPRARHAEKLCDRGRRQQTPVRVIRDVHRSSSRRDSRLVHEPSLRSAITAMSARTDVGLERISLIADHPQRQQGVGGRITPLPSSRHLRPYEITEPNARRRRPAQPPGTLPTSRHRPQRGRPVPPAPSSRSTPILAWAPVSEPSETAACGVCCVAPWV